MRLVTFSVDEGDLGTRTPNRWSTGGGDSPRLVRLGADGYVNFLVPSEGWIGRCSDMQADLGGITLSSVEELAAPGYFAGEVRPRLEARGIRVPV
jgi:hypothetical protein